VSFNTILCPTHYDIAFLQMHHSTRESAGGSFISEIESFAADWLSNLGELGSRSIENPSDREIQNCVQQIQMLQSHEDVTDSNLANMLREYQCQKEERQLRDVCYFPCHGTNLDNRLTAGTDKS
jgi:hypothetical protein